MCEESGCRSSALRAWGTNCRRDRLAGTTSHTPANQHRPESLTAASSIVRRATSQEESPANLSTVFLAPPPLLHLLQRRCLHSAPGVCWRAARNRSSARYLVPRWHTRRPKIHPANTALELSLKPRSNAVNHHHHHHVGQAHPVCRTAQRNTRILTDI